MLNSASRAACPKRLASAVVSSPPPRKNYEKMTYISGPGRDERTVETYRQVRKAKSRKKLTSRIWPAQKRLPDLAAAVLYELCYVWIVIVLYPMKPPPRGIFRFRYRKTKCPSVYNIYIFLVYITSIYTPLSERRSNMHRYSPFSEIQTAVYHYTRGLQSILRPMNSEVLSSWFNIMRIIKR